MSTKAKAKKQPMNVSDIPKLFAGSLKQLSAYRVILFFLVVASLYGYILWRINVYSNAPASSSEEATQTTKQPHINPATVAKIKSLQDNSVNVQSLFDAARQNPFQE